VARDDLIVGLDIGTSKVCAIVAQIGHEGRLEIIGVGTTPSRGLRRGVVINIDATVRSLLNAVEAAEMMSGREVTGAFAGIAGGHIEGINSRGVVAVTGRDREITREDVERVIDAAKAIVIPMDREVVHVIPQEFTVDQQDGVRDPVGMMGVRLEAEVHIVTGAVSSAQNIIRCINRAGFKADDIVLEPLAAAAAVLSKDEQELGVLLVDIGGGTTDILVYLDGAPYHTGVLALGGDQVTSDISIMLKTPLEVAERLKHEAGSCHPDDLDDEEIEASIPGVGGRPPRPVRRSRLTEIIRPRMTEVFGMVKDQLDRAGYLNLLSGGAVLTGGGALLPGAAELATEVLGLPVRIGYPTPLGGLVEEYRSPQFATGVGLVMYGHGKRRPEHFDMDTSESGYDSVWDRMKRWFREFI
jgi:cell division protein FtsA